MGFLRRFAGGPYMDSPRNLAAPSAIQKASYQIVPGDHGLPVVQLSLRFPQWGQAVTNPDMSLVVLIDRSGSMQETFSEGHVYNVAAEILRYTQAADTGFDLVFYDNEMSDSGHIGSLTDLARAINNNPPRGSTYLAATLRRTLETYHQKRGIYAIVITDGEFADKQAVQQYVVDALLPKLTPENPFAFRLHFVGAGHEVDHAFLQQLELAASGQGFQLVKHHHHVHLRHSHADILDELDSAFIGIGDHVVLGQNESGGPTAITRVGNVATRHWHEGNLQDIGFVPRRALVGLEYQEPHPHSLDVLLRSSARMQAPSEVQLRVPLPQAASTTTPAAAPPSRPRFFHLPWRHQTTDGGASATEAAASRAAMAQRTQEERLASQQRQASDMQRLGRGGVPSMAVQRLTALRNAGDAQLSFTSDLAPDEAALLRRNGYRALGLVCGSAMYHVGRAFASSSGDCEVDVLSRAYTDATRLAVGRMQQEAQTIGAHGVIGVRFDIVRREWADKTIEVQLLGTAIAGQDAPPATPFLSDLSGQEWWALQRGGYDPVALVFGHCTWFVLTTQNDEWAEKSGTNQELSHMSQALSQCRHRANGAVQAMARQAGASGVVGVHLSRRLEEIRLSGPGEDPAYEREHHNLTLSIIGTAVRQRADAPRSVRATTNVLSLRSDRLTPHTITTPAATFE